MEVIIGKTAGFCFGIANAVNKSVKECEKNGKIYCLGDLANNKQVIEDLERKGVIFIDNINDIVDDDPAVSDKKTKIIIRAHGIPKQTYETIKNLNIELVDLTCPKVLKVHKIAEEYANKDYYIFLVGKANHPEIIGTISCCGRDASIIENIEDIEEAVENLEKSNKKNAAIICQTTINGQKFEEIVKNTQQKLNKNIQLEVINTICEATRVRQEETGEIAKQVDAMIVIGGKHSSNSNKLYEIAKENCKDSVIVETKEELDIEYLKQFKKVGVMAGASTPKKSIEEVVEILEKL